MSRYRQRFKRRKKFKLSYWRCPLWQILNQQKKRIKVINTKTERNKAIKTKVKTYIKKVEAAIAANDKAAASEALTACISEISKATSKGIFHKNTASRKIARLSKAVNAIA